MALLHVELFLLVSHIASGFSFKIRSRYGRDSSSKGEPLNYLAGLHPDLLPFLAPELPRWKQVVPAVPVAKVVPEYVIISASKDQKVHLKPEKGARALPQSVQDMLLVTVPPAAPGQKSLPVSKVAVKCLDNMLVVTVKKDLFKSFPGLNLKLGLCAPTSNDATFYHFRYTYDHACGFNRQATADHMHVSTALIYNPPGPVIRDVGFNIPIKCNLPRFFHSYKVGYYPLLEGGTVRKSLTPRTEFMIVPQNAAGVTIGGGTGYTLGEQMFFEAKRTHDSTIDPTLRLYVNKCFVTSTPSSTSARKYTVIDNQGCMVDGKETPLSKFIVGTSKMVQRFSIAALVFKDIAITSASQILFMHCEISIAPIQATEGFKACSYDQGTKTWQELYGYNHMCGCCDNNCPGQVKASNNVVTSKSWMVNFSEEDGQVEPKVASPDELKNAVMADQKGFVNYWDHDD